MEIHWGSGSGFNFGRIPGTDVRVERTKHFDKTWSFMLSDDQYTYLHVDSEKFQSSKEMEEGVFKWLVMKGRV